MSGTRTLEDLKQEFQNGNISKADFIRHALDLHSQLFAYVRVTQATDVHEISVSRDGVCFVVGDEQIRMFAPENEARVAPVEIMNFGRYEPEETRVMDLLSADACHFVDVGANIGWHALRLAKRNTKARVHAFEPIPVTYSFLERNVALNGLGGRVSCYNFGLSDKSGSFNFFVAPSGGTNASLLNVAQVEDAKKITGLALTMDEWCSNQDIEPDFIKCDVEGAELLVFRGARATLARCKPIVFSELLRKWAKPFGYHPNDLLLFFRELGYDCYAVGPAGVRCVSVITDETVETNYAFLHRDAHQRAIAMLEVLR